MKGICFIEPLFHLIIEGKKTQTRRMMTPQPDARGTRTTNVLFEDYHGKEIKPRYKKGEILYLKEPYVDDLGIDKIFYKFNKDEAKTVSDIFRGTGIKNPWKNKLFMPKSAARYFIKITDIRDERLQDITEEDCFKEGIITVERGGYLNGAYDISREWDYKYACSSDSPIKAYAALIDKINGKGTWESNPFVFVYDFELMPF